MRRYLALEGGDGSGKTTVVSALASRLSERGDQVVVVREPGGTDLGEKVRSILLDSNNVDRWAEVFLFAAQRSQLARDVVLPALELGAWVISDRSYYSSIAYQGRARGLGEAKVREINEIGLEGVEPDHVFVLEVDPGTALGRQKRPDRIGAESVEFQQEVHNAYAELAREEPQRVILLRGDDDVDTLVERILEVIDVD